MPRAYPFGLSVRLSHDQEADLRLFADRLGQSLSTAARVCIDYALENGIAEDREVYEHFQPSPARVVGPQASGESTEGRPSKGSTGDSRRRGATD